MIGFLSVLHLLDTTQLEDAWTRTHPEFLNGLSRVADWQVALASFGHHLRTHLGQTWAMMVAISWAHFLISLGALVLLQDSLSLSLSLSLSDSIPVKWTEEIISLGAPFSSFCIYYYSSHSAMSLRSTGGGANM